MKILSDFLNEYILYFPLILFVFLALRYFIISSVMYVLLWKIFPDKLTKRLIQPKNIYEGQIFSEIKYSLIGFAVMALICWPLMYLYKFGYTSIYLNWSEHSLWWIPAGVLIFFFWHDIYFYWSHKWLHTRSMYKHVHYIHHLCRVPTPFASHSFHWFEAILQIIFIYPIVIFVPMHAWTFIGYMALTHFFATWGHLNYELMPFKAWSSWWGSWVTTSTHHNFHHKYNNGNFALYLRFWDRRFGSLNEKTAKRFDEYLDN